ncbi:MAG: SapC family protein [Chlorobiaceae bacterium]|nr:SapC family protein [Chlorobiaceae bacterium]
MMYSNAVALNSERHSDFTISPSPKGYHFAADLLTVMIVASEFYDAGRQFPIIFTISPENVVQPVVLLGFEEGENLFVDDEGKWTGRYIPAYLRRYPFITTDESEDGQAIVCFDESFDGFNLEGGIPLFENREPTAKTIEIQGFLQGYLVQLKQTREFGSILLEKDLFREISAQANLVDGRTYGLNGMHVVDEQKLAELSEADVNELFKAGLLPLVYAHLLSLRNLQELVERKGTRSTAE